MNEAEITELRFLLHQELRRQMQVKTQSGCTGKQAFESFAQANGAIRAESTRRECSPYRCTFCRAWHVGRPQKQLRAPQFGSKRRYF